MTAGARAALVAIVFALGLAHPAAADERVSLGAVIAASVADAVTTEVTLHTTRGTFEANPILAGGAVRRELTKAATTGALVWATSRIARTHPRLASVIAWTAAGSLAAIAAHNAQIGAR